MKNQGISSRIALGLGAALLALVSSTMVGLPHAQAASGSQGPQKPTGPVGGPQVAFAQNDLAAVSLVPSILNQGSSSGRISRIPILTATCKNLGFKGYLPGTRRLNIRKKVGNLEVTAASQAIPALTPGQTFTFVYQAPLDNNTNYWLEVTNDPSDQNSSNDLFTPMWVPVEKH